MITPFDEQKADVLTTYYHMRLANRSTPYQVMSAIRDNAANIIARSCAARRTPLPVFVDRWVAAEEYCERMCDQGGYWFRFRGRRA